jgi:hypothetical protein
LSTQQSYCNALDEWKEARSVIARFDNNLHDLRKYGFSFVTALLAANGLISISQTEVVPAEVKASILVVTMGLIVALKLLDCHYLCFEKAASYRCRILEDRLNLELTGDLAFFYNLEKWWVNILLLYLGFIGLTATLGIAILWNHPILLVLTIVATVISAVLILILDIRRSTKKDLQDWTVDLKIVHQRTPLRITYTNLNSNEREKPGRFMLWWTVKSLQKQNLKEPLEEPSVKEVNLRSFQSYVWLWETANVQPGLYEFEMFSTRVTRPEMMNMIRDKETKEPELREHFTSIMSQVGNAPIKWIIQVTPAPQQAES